jgi:hypothetical protein
MSHPAQVNTMFEFFDFATKQRLSFSQLQTVQMVAQQVVLSLESSVRIPGAAKKAVALQIMGSLLEQLGIVAPDSLVDTSIEVAVKLLKALDLQSLPPEVRPKPVSSLKLDISGRPATGNNSEKGLSL